ncbi:GPCR kinase [Tanacetum coccineum]
MGINVYVDNIDVDVTEDLLRENFNHWYRKDIILESDLILANVSVFSPKPSMHYLNITMRNVVKVFHKDSVPGNDSDVGGSGMLMKEEEIVKLMEEEEMADLELQLCENVIDQEDLYKFDEEALNLALEKKQGNHGLIRSG